MEGSTGSDSGPYLGKVSPAEEASVSREGLNAEIEALDLGFTVREGSPTADGFSQSSFPAVEVNGRAGSDAVAAYENREGGFSSGFESLGGRRSEALAFEPPSSSMNEGGTGSEERGAFVEPSFLAVGDDALRGLCSDEVAGDANGEKREVLAGMRGGMLQGSRLAYAAASSALDKGGKKGMEDVAGDFVQGSGRDNGNAGRAESLHASVMAVEIYSAEDDLEDRCGGNAGEDAGASCSVAVDFVASDLRSTVEGQVAEEVFGNLVWVEEDEDCDRSMELVESVEQSFSTIEEDCVYGTGKTLSGDENREGNDFLVELEDQRAEGSRLVNPGFEVPHCKLNERGDKAMEEVPEKFGLESAQDKSVEQDGVSNFLHPVIEHGVQDSLEQAPAGIENREEQSFLARWRDGCVEGSGSMNMVCEAPGVSLEDGGIKGMEVLCGDVISEDGENKNTERNDSVNPSFPSVGEQAGNDLEHDPAGNKNTEGPDFCIGLHDGGTSVQEQTERILAAQEETGINGINLHSIAIGVVERNHTGFEQGHVEQEGALKEMGFELVEAKEPAVAAECRRADIDQVGFQNMSGMAEDQRQETDTSAMRVHRAACYVPTVQGYVPTVQGLLPMDKGSGGPIDAMADVNKSQNEGSIGLNGQVQPYNALDKPLAEASCASEETGQETRLDPVAPPEEVEPMEQIQCDLQAGYTQKASEEPSSMEVTEVAEVGFVRKPITGLVTAVQRGDNISATVEDQGTSEASACVKTVKGLSDVVVPGTDEHQNLKKQPRDIVAFNEPPTCSDLENQPNDGVQLEEPFNLGEKKENDMQDGSSPSPLLQIIKMNRRRKSFNAASISEQLGFHKSRPKEHQFSVGDLVWGKVRSHPWWPGQIFDASHSSEIAKKHFKKNCMLVAYFGDATFGWCKGDESHLIPFQDNFEEKSKQTPAKGFCNAVMNALDELARRVELGLTCFCQYEEARSRLERKAIVNAGICDGAFVNDHRDISSAVNAFHPLEFLSTIQSWARSPRMARTLDVTVARAQVSAILTFKGFLLSGKISEESLGKQTASEEMAGSTSPSPTLERHINLDIVSGNKFTKSCSSSSGKNRCKSGGMQSRSPKKRRIGDLIAGNEVSYKADEDMDGHDETLLEIAGSKAKFLRKLLKIRQKSLRMDSALNKRSFETASTAGHVLEKVRSDDVVKTREEKGSLPGKATLLKTAKTKEGGYLLRELTPVRNNQHQKLETISASDVVVNDLRTMQANRSLAPLSPGGDRYVKKTPKSFKFGECIMKVASELTSTPLGTRCRDERGGSLHRKVILPKTAEPKEEEGCLPRKVTPMRTKKHQKLDALFASDAIMNGSRSIKAKRDLVSSCSGGDQHAKKTPKSFKFGECILKVASELTSTQPGTKCMDGEVGHKTQEGGRKIAVNADKNIFSSPSSKPKAMWPFRESGSTHELLSELLTVAQQPLYWVGEKKMPSRLINSFLEFRNAVFQKSPGYGFYDSDVTKASAFKFLNQSHKLKSPKNSSKLAGSSNPENSQESDWIDKISFPRPKGHRVQEKLKRKAELPVEGARKKSRHSIRLPSPPWSSKSSKQKQEQKVGDRYAKHYSRRTILPQLPVKSSRGLPADSNANQNPAALFMRFPKGFALPSETELKAKFTRFGPLEISETKVFRRSGCAQVVFKRCSDAEVAFNFVSENNLFGSASVSFRLRFLSSATQTNTIQKTDHERYEKSIQHEFRQARQPPLLKDTPRDVEGHQENMVQSCGSIVPFVEKVGPSRPNTLGEPPLLFIQQNLEMMTSMLSRSAECASTSTMPKSDNAAPDSKADIMDEMMCLLQKVSALVGSPPP